MTERDCISERIPDNETHQHQHAVDVGHKLCNFGPRYRRVLWVRGMPPAVFVATRDESVHFDVLSTVRLSLAGKPHDAFARFSSSRTALSQ
jgi:hypothetical protein